METIAKVKDYIIKNNLGLEHFSFHVYNKNNKLFASAQDLNSAIVLACEDQDLIEYYDDIYK